MKEETWKDIKNYEGLYQVSNLGNVKSLNYRRMNKEQLLKQSTNNFGYKTVMLNKKGKSKMLSVHRLVAQAFIPNILNKSEINHIDLDKTNNCVNNLEWVTHKENTDYRDLTNKGIGNSHLTIDEVNDIRSKREKGKSIHNVFKEYSNKMKFSGFQKVWYYKTWKLKEEGK